MQTEGVGSALVGRKSPVLCAGGVLLCPCKMTPVSPHSTPPRLRTGESMHLVSFWPSPTSRARRERQRRASGVRWWVGRANPHSTITPRAYAQTVVQKLCLRGQAKGRFVGIKGDLNGTADLGATNNIRDWLSTLHVKAPLSEHLLPEQEYFTFFNGVTGVSRIDHVLHSSLPSILLNIDFNYKCWCAGLRPPTICTKIFLAYNA
jgi:hypothetical protein